MTSVEVCSICDIAGCHHIRERTTITLDRSAFEALVNAANNLRDPIWRLILRDEDCIDSPCADIACECRQKLERIMRATNAALKGVTP